MNELKALKSEKLRRLYRDFPDAYACDVFGAVLTEAQCEILSSVERNRRTAAKASHAIGKTFVAAIAACWWYDCWDEHIVYITAPTWAQCLGLTFKQIKLLRRERNLPGDILETGWVRDPNPLYAPAHFIRALNAETGEGFQGEHTAPILLLYEEAVGIDPNIIEAGDGLMTVPECRLLAIGNPTDESSPFGQMCSSRIYNVITINGLEHPNIAAELAGQPAPFPKAVRLNWIEEMIAKECEPTAERTGDTFEFPPQSGLFYLPNANFQGRVLGEFPSQADQQVIPKGWLADLPVSRPEVMPQIGVDVARHGSDRTTLAARSGLCVLALSEVRQMNLASVTGAIIRMAVEVGMRTNFPPKKIPIHVDVTGGLGAGPADFLRERGYNAVDVNSSSAAIDKETYPNKRSELWFVTRERARTKDMDLSRLPAEIKAKLLRELSTPTWKLDSAGRKVVEPKPDIKKRLGESPDLADALNLSFDGTLAADMTHAIAFAIETQSTIDW